MEATNLDYEILFDKVHVYKNLIKDPQGFVELLKKSEADPSTTYTLGKWEPWSIFGTYMTAQVYHPQLDDTDAIEKYNKEKEYTDNIEQSFKESVKHYLSVYGESVKDNWSTMGPSYCKYAVTDKNMGDPTKGENLSMVYHTDYQWYEFDSDRDKFAVTCTIYLNDDYEGGEVIFRVRGTDKTFSYKPSAGDVVIFPSGHPELLSEDGLYFHSVGKVLNKEKYFVRCFYLIPNTPSAKFLEYQEKYGKEVWWEMYDKVMQERIKNAKQSELPNY